MYLIEKKEYGFKITFSGFIRAEEMKLWMIESMQLLVESPEKFSLFIDMRNLKPLPDGAQVHLCQGQKYYKRYGMLRSVVIVDDVITAMQFKRIAIETDIFEQERYIDTSTVFDWEKVGLEWIRKGIEPDSLLRMPEQGMVAI